MSKENPIEKLSVCEVSRYTSVQIRSDLLKKIKNQNPAPDSADSSEYYVTKFITLDKPTIQYFSLWSPEEFICLYENCLSVMVF